MEVVWSAHSAERLRRACYASHRIGGCAMSAIDEAFSDSWVESEAPSALSQIDAYLATLGQGRTIVEANEVRNLLLDIRATLNGRD